MNQEQRLEAFRQLIATRPPEQLTERMGIRVTEVTHDRVVGTMPVDGNRQPYGLLHGGAACVLADTLGGVAAALHAFPDGRILGVDFNIAYHRSVRRGLVTGICTPLHQGRGLASYQIVLTNDEGGRVCSARVTCAVRTRADDSDESSPGPSPMSEV
jgi:1,4-dihydroxy-2-naphthoyl-CoA hydrolase